MLETWPSQLGEGLGHQDYIDLPSVLDHSSMVSTGRMDDA